MKNLIKSAITAVVCVGATCNGAGVEYLSVNQMNVETVCRMFTHATSYNITATADAQKKLCSFLFTDGDVEQALSSMCISSSLVYRKDPIYQGFQVMTLDEFRKNTVFSASEVIEVFKVEPTNLEIIAEAIEALFPSEATFSDPTGVLDLSSTSSAGGSGNNDSNNSNDRSSDDRSSNNSRSVTNNGSSQSGSQLNSNDGTLFDVLETKTITKAESHIGTSINITANLEHSQLIVRTANVSALTKIRKLVKDMDLPLRQVLLEMKILELNVGDGETLGVDWSAVQGEEKYSISERNDDGSPSAASFLGYDHNLGLGNFATEAASTFVYSYLSRDIQARIQALASNNDVEVIATPMLMAVSNREATIVVAEERVIVTGASQDRTISGDNGTVNDQIVTETEVRDIGTTLKIVPRVNNDGTVSLHVSQESSTVKVGNNRIPVGGSLISVDSVEKASIQASVVAQDGKTIAIGGLIRSENSYSVDKVPLLGDLPLLGKLFRLDKTSSRKTELILLITPRIINGGSTTRTDEILKISKNRYTTGGLDLIDSQNQGLDFYEGRTNDSLLPRLNLEKKDSENKPPKKKWFKNFNKNNPDASKKATAPIENSPFRVRR